MSFLLSRKNTLPVSFDSLKRTYCHAYPAPDAFIANVSNAIDHLYCPYFASSHAQLTASAFIWINFHIMPPLFSSPIILLFLPLKSKRRGNGLSCKVIKQSLFLFTIVSYITRLTVSIRAYRAGPVVIPCPGPAA